MPACPPLAEEEVGRPGPTPNEVLVSGESVKDLSLCHPRESGDPVVLSLGAIRSMSEGAEPLPLPEREVGWPGPTPNEVLVSGESVKDLALCHPRESGDPVVLSLGAIRSMKRTHHIISAFEIAKEKVPNLRLLIAGSAEGKYGKKVIKMIECSKNKDSIEYLGKISKEKKIEILQKSHLLAVTSVKEGWGLVITEANSQGTPAVVYDVDGLRDAVKNGETGIVCQINTPENLAENMIKLLENKEKYEKLRKNAWEWSKEINFDRSYEEFIKLIT
jgi:glycosyltransferase involved in cell wall biosynthesis